MLPFLVIPAATGGCPARTAFGGGESAHPAQIAAVSCRTWGWTRPFAVLPDVAPSRPGSGGASPKNAPTRGNGVAGNKEMCLAVQPENPRKNRGGGCGNFGQPLARCV